MHMKSIVDDEYNQVSTREKIVIFNILTTVLSSSIK